MFRLARSLGITNTAAPSMPVETRPAPSGAAISVFDGITRVAAVFGRSALVPKLSTPTGGAAR